MNNGEESVENTGGIKRTYTERGSASSEPDQDTKKEKTSGEFVCNFKELERDENKIPTSAASIGECTKFLFDQFKILSHNFQELAKANEFSSSQAQDAMRNNAALAELVGEVSASVTRVLNENSRLNKENEQLQEKLLKLECHQRRDNLIFEGFQEIRGETDLDIYTKIVRAISRIHDIQNPYAVRISRCHRVGPYQKGQTRPVVAHFNWFGDRSAILRNKRQLPYGIYVHEDYPTEIDDRRKILRPILNMALQKNEYKGKVYMAVDKLIVNKKAYTVRPKYNLDELPVNLNPEKLCEKRNENTIVFFGQGSVFSNHHPAKYTDGPIQYSCSEQEILSAKASLFNDDIAHDRIMTTSSPLEMKRISNRIRNFDKKIWEEKSPEIARRALMKKFGQNEHLKKKLLDTQDYVLAEACRDTLWGTGVPLRETGCLDTQNWTGRGIMGDALMHVRDALKSAK